jgi:hypothetical protein
MNVYNLTKEDIFKGVFKKPVYECNVNKNMVELPFHDVYSNISYEDAYSITPYATYMMTPLSKMDGEDIVSRFDRCYGEWENIRKCPKKDGPNKCKRVKHEFIIHNPDYTGEHCRDKEGRRLRDGDTRNKHCYKECQRLED